jgi:hypothetical protein
VQLPLAVNVTSRPDDVNAPTSKLGSPNVAFLIASNWMIDWSVFCAVTDSTTGGAAAYVASPAWSYRTTHVPVPLVIVKRPAAFVQGPLAENVTGNPDVLSAETVNAVLYVAVAGAWVVTTIVWGVVPAAALAVNASAPTTQTSRRASLMRASVSRSCPKQNFALAAHFPSPRPLIEPAPTQ